MEIRDGSQAKRLAAQVMRQAMGILAQQLDADIDNLFLEDRWPWPNETARKSGEVVSSPRNIYDLGNLYNSEEEILEQDEQSVTITRTWTAEYADLVHNGTTKTQARPWTERLKEEQEQAYADLFAEEFVRRFQNL